ncbi:MAG: metallophosphoesterase family protein [Lachnospiraceae bacterium]|nr:metallophosphoesterase family protein [Lachnospiraceae bacterium]
MKKLLSLLLAAVLALGILPAFGVSASESDTILDLTVQPGGDPTSLNFNWITHGQPSDVFVEIAPYGGDFNAKKQVFYGESKKTGATDDIDGTAVSRYSCKATATGLKPGALYNYRVGDGKTLSALHTVTTQEADRMSAYIVSDIHVIEMESWNKKLPESVENWQITLDQMLDRDEAPLIVSLGDQMQNTTRTDYLDGFFGIDGLADTVLAPINGNHDISPASANLPLYTNTPNQVFPGSMGIGDYYFMSGNVLFVMLSITDINFDEVDHEKTFEEAIKAYPDYDWMVVGFHEAIYGYYLHGYSAAKGDAFDYCSETYDKFITIFDKYKPDLCLTGHSHSYCRSYFIRDWEAVDVDTDADGAFLSPAGTLYVNMGTSSRMKEFGNQDATPNWPWGHIAFSVHGHASYTYALLEAEGDTLSLEVRDNLKPDTVIDTVTIRKEIVHKETEPVTEAATDPETGATAPTEKAGDPMKTAFFVALAAAVVIWIAALILWADKKKKGEAK